MLQPYQRPFYWVVPNDVIDSGRLYDLVKARITNKTVALDGGQALAFEIPEVVQQGERAVDYPHFLRIMRSVKNAIGDLLPSHVSATFFEGPWNQCWCRCLLQPNEVEFRRFCSMLSWMKEMRPFGLHVSFWYHETWPQTLNNEVVQFLEAWYAAATAKREPEQRLTATGFSIERYKHPAKDRRWGHCDGLLIRLDYQEPVVWPWINLYLCARRVLAKKGGLSFRFIHPVETQSSPAIRL